VRLRQVPDQLALGQTQKSPGGEPGRCIRWTSDRPSRGSPDHWLDRRGEPRCRRNTRRPDPNSGATATA
jgi:hypothetical protein